jgi:phenylpropionate dioxygenase-like ring-hydroxylating dioxygenase large terminal subunit
MVNLFTFAKRLLGDWSRLQDLDDCSDGPLSHPALQRITPEQLADLPFGRGRASVECGHTPTGRSVASSGRGASGG